ncbi:InlB B-repeat-containing protein [Lysinibacillus cavernae]|uniref:InlB B-repeat-containing protein n=1 Tax=Lysinibacillus cavernae TaxID=2666135 RepID=UPI0012D96022|nr:InlB B-repeat-containing protein [Lysinibacillus cavernae]
MRKMSKFKCFIPIIFFSFYILFSNNIVFANSIENDFNYGDNITGVVPEKYYPGGVTIYGNLGMSRKDLVLPDILGGKPVTTIWIDAFNNKQLTSLEFSNNTKLISYGAFQNNQLTSVMLSNQLEWIGYFAFNNNNLSSITIPSSVKEIGENAFIGNDLKTITVFGANTVLLQNSIPNNTKILGIIPSKAKEYSDANGFAFEEIANKITYDGNGQTSGELSEDYTGNTTKTFIVKNQGSLKKIGYTFIGWNSKHDGSGTDYNVGEEIVINQDITLYAKWEEGPFLVSYESNGGTTVAPETVARNTIVMEPPVPTKTGYTFDGWYKEAALTNVWDFTKDMVTGDTTLYAKWDVTQYEVTFNSDGGSMVASQFVTPNTKATAPPVPKKLGYIFDGWYKNNAFSAPWDFTTDVVTEAITLYGKWTTNPTYTVIYDKNGATGGTVPLDNKAYEDNDSVTVQDNRGQLVRTNYTFKGWNTQADGKGTSYVEKATFQMRKTDVTLYAEWTVNPPTTGGDSNPPPGSNDNDYSPPTKVKITLHTNGGTVIAPIDIRYNTKVNDLPVPTRAGYRFDGWYQDEALIKRWAEEIIVRENISLYAKWIELPVEKSESPQDPQPSKPIVTFSDVEGHWAKAMMEELATLGIIQGYEDGTFRPNTPISRMHVAVLLTRAFSLKIVREADDFSDVASTHPYYEAIQALQQAGIVDGSNGAFRPTENMTRAQLAKVLVGVLGLTPEGASSFVDVDSTHWSSGYIAVLEREGITLGDNGNFHPNVPVTRAQFVAFLYRIIQK